MTVHRSARVHGPSAGCLTGSPARIAKQGQRTRLPTTEIANREDETHKKGGTTPTQ